MSIRGRAKWMVETCGRAVLGRYRAAVFLHGIRLIDRNRYYDWLTEEIMAKCIKRDSVCFDVGCHAGSMLRQMLALAPEGRHFAFEPLPDFFVRLERDFKNPRVQLYRLALSNENGKVSFQHAVENPAYSGLRKRKYESDHEIVEEIEVETKRLDDIVEEAGLGALDFIKIDVEGAERLVLEGARKSISRFKPVIVFECGLGGADFYQTTPEAMFDLLGSAGLRISLLADFLGGRPSLERAAFSDRFNRGRDFFWVAHP